MSPQSNGRYRTVISRLALPLYYAVHNIDLWDNFLSRAFFSLPCSVDLTLCPYPWQTVCYFPRAALGVPGPHDRAIVVYKKLI